MKHQLVEEVSGQELLEAIRAENLAVYRASPVRLREDVAQEAEISHDYRGRLVYELLQNADDAMIGNPTLDDRIVFLLDDEDLWVGNGGRPLSPLDVRGLCATGASAKGEPTGPRRASIGHKGMGFKSVLEITERPMVYSLSNGFQLDAELARGVISNLFSERAQPAPKHLPVTRFPWPLNDEPRRWEEMRERRINTLFRFPLRGELGPDQRDLLEARLVGLPVTSILFLKHLERVEVKIERGGRTAQIGWTVRREQHVAGAWKVVPGFHESGVFRVSVDADSGEEWQFLVAHEADLQIGDHRAGLSGVAWGGIEYSEVSVAAPWQRGGAAMPSDWQRIHVFLPTGEVCPYPLLVNGAFAADLSRQEIRVSPEPADYNRFLTSRAAELLTNTLFPALLSEGASVPDVLRLLDRGATPPGIALVLVEEIRKALRDLPLVPTETGDLIPVPKTVVPPPLDKQDGVRFRQLLGAEATIDLHTFPDSEICVAPIPRVLVDHGARELSPAEAARVLAGADPDRSRLRLHDSGKYQVDPVLDMLAVMWRKLPYEEEAAFQSAVRAESLFPTSVFPDGRVLRVKSAHVECFYPPRSFAGTLPLTGLRFLLQDVAWGSLTPRERNSALEDEMQAWHALFGVREFRFADVMRASVLPALELEPSPERAKQRHDLQSMERLAAVCQLAGRTPKTDATLPYQRLGPDRALFNLARLPVPCLERATGEIVWKPAYSVYFGADWIGDSSIEPVIDEATAVFGEGAVGDVSVLAPPSTFEGLLSRYRGLRSVDEVDDADAQEVSVDEDDEVAFEASDKERWLTFLTWIGVNYVLRPVHFDDIESRAEGWLSTGGLSKPQGGAFKQLGRVWDQYVTLVRRAVQRLDPHGTATAYFYQLHDLEHLRELTQLAAKDVDSKVARALWAHLARNWGRLERFSELQVALVPLGKQPSMRTKPAKPFDDELRQPLDNFWLRRLRSREFAPTSHGPRKPSTAWLPSPEIDRRFSRKRWTAGNLVPLLDVPTDLLRGKALGFAKAVGIRDSLSPSTFEIPDARVLLRRIKLLFESDAASGTLSADALRQIIRPAYRNLFDLLTGREQPPESDKPPLGEEPLLSSNGAGRFQFIPGAETVFTERNGARERIGIEGEFWNFVLEGYPAASAPLVRLMGSRPLEGAVVWSAQPSECPLDAAGVAAFRAGLEELAPFILARLRADRAEDRQANQDARRLRSFIDLVEPVEDVEVWCHLDGRELATRSSRDYFVHPGVDGSMVAYVRWGPNPWPPAWVEAEGLASALSDLFQASLFESFMALINAESTQSRLRVLRLAGAPTDLLEAQELLAEAAEEEPNAEEAITAPVPPTAGDDEDEDEGTESPGARQPNADGGRIPLYRPEDLLLEGTAVLVTGETDGRLESKQGTGSKGEGDGGGGWGRGATDLDELNRVGMAVALSYELKRIGGEYPPAAIFNPLAPSPSAIVFDVSTSSAIQAAKDASPAFRDVLAHLRENGLSERFPGFDILSLDPTAPGLPSRLIELKSSGVNAIVQTMTWNEWKTARTSRLRSFFHLYLVGNLRSDLIGVRPFIRGIHDPFGALWAVEHEEITRRSVQLNVRQFHVAEHFDLTVRPRASDGSDGTAPD